MKVENFKQFSLKMIRCEARAFPVGTDGYMISRPFFFTPRKTRMRMNLDTWLAAILFLGETSSIIAYWLLAVSMPPTKVCPQCKAAVPVRRKTCERCDLSKNRVNLREKAV